MRKVRSAVSLFLVLLVLLGIQLFVSSDIKAATGTFTNVQYKDGIISWDKFPDAYGAKIQVYRQDNGKQLIFCVTSADCYDLNEALSTQGLTDIAVFVTLDNNDSPDNSYHWEGSFYCKIPILKSIENVKLDSEELSWTHDTSNVEGQKVSYTILVQCEEIQNLWINTTDTSIPIKQFAYLGTHDYTFTITAKAQGYKSATTTVDFKSKTFEGDSITGFKIEEDMVMWDDFQKADRYMLYFSYVNSKGERKNIDTDIYATSAFYAPYIINRYVNSREKGEMIPDQDIRFCIAPCKWKTHIGLANFIDYHYENQPVKKFPISVYGLQLDSTMDITYILDHCTYYPATNTIVMKSFDTRNGGTLKRLKDGMDASKPMFYSTENLTVIGGADIVTPNEAFVCTKDITFKLEYRLRIYTENAGAIKGNNIKIENGSMDIKSQSEPALTATGTLTVSENKYSYCFETQSDKPEDGALMASELVLEGIEGHQSPNNAYFNKYRKTFVTADGNVEKYVYFTIPNRKPSPTPTSMPSPAPTKAPTKTPTKAPATATPKPGTPTKAPVVSGKPSPSTDPKVQIMEFVKRIYIYVLDREPEEEGGAFWTDELYAFRRTGAEVAQGFIFSPEFESRNTTDEQFVTILYKTFFGRDPEDEGMKFWLSQLSSGTMDRITVANGFIYSQEWADTCASYGIRSGGNLKPTGAIEPTALTYSFVERMYNTALGRGYDEEGRQYWASCLANFETTGELVGASFFLSDEMTSYSLSDEEFLNRLYLTFMDRESDADGAAYWLGVMKSGTPRSDVVFGFTRSAEFTDKCIEARILPY